MKLASTIAELHAALAGYSASGRPVGFVPTMGGLHAGHASLLDASKAAGDVVVVSIFVNPTQFGPGEDFSRYPRPIEQDRMVCHDHGCDVLFAPTVEEIYPPGDQTRVRPGRLAEGMCGPFRPGHFEGVCTVVARLFNIVRPDRAYFGQKDAQQALILRQMAHDLRYSIEIVVCPIVREPDGLALSTRNQYLGPAERQQALSVYRALCHGKHLIESDERRSGRVAYEMRRGLDSAGPCTVEYIAVVDPQSLEEQSSIKGPVMLALAVRIGTARLIDNLIAEPPEAK